MGNDKESLDNQHVELAEAAQGSIDTKSIVHDGRAATALEHSMSLREAVRVYWKAIFWSALLSTSVIMEGYDIVLVTSLYAQPAFARKYGTYHPGAGYQLAGAWQSALGLAPMIGAIFGAFGNGWLTHRFGYRRVLIASLVSIIALIFLLFFAVNPEMLLAGLVLCGVPWGIFATMAPAYASEVCPLPLRGYLAAYVNLCWALGQLVAAGVLEGLVNRMDEWAYRIPFAVQWVWPLPLLALLWFAPESPWWFVRNGQLVEAKRSLQRLASRSADIDMSQVIAMMVHTNHLEMEAESGTSYMDCFRRTDLYRTEIVCLVFAVQVWSGSSLGGTPVYFFEQAGLSSDNAFKFSCGGLGLASLGTIVSWFLLSAFGRRTLYVWGLAICTACMLVVGIIAAVAGQGTTSSYTQAGFVLAWLLTYYLTVGPVCYAIISETSATRLRSKSICLARNAYYVSQIIGNVIEPYMVNPTEANWHGKAGFFWAGTCLVSFVWAFFRLPETKDRTFEELDILFAKKVPAREFGRASIDAYAAEPESQIRLQARQ